MLSTTRRRTVLVLIGVAFAIFSLSCISDCMRESDQASVLTGVWELFRGARVVGESYYNYEKLYETYWLTTLGFWIRSLFGSVWSPVLVGNISTGITFWATTLAAIFLLAKDRRRPPVLSTFCYLSTPAILINSLYTNAAILSAGFLLLAGILLTGKHTLVRRALGAFFFFIAVGARADAVLLAPLIIWLQLPSHNWFRRAFTDVTTWLVFFSGAAAVLLGLKLFAGHPIYSWVGFWGFKVFAGFLVFGLGASLLLLVVFCAVILIHALSAPSVQRASFYLVGAIALALPLLYYSVQLWSPRYVVTTAIGVFLFSASSRGAALFRFGPYRSAVYRMRLAGGVLAMLLLIVGLRVPSPAAPRLTFVHPTLFPTADGLHPMGAYLSFLFTVRGGARHEIDHNQLIWAAAESATYVPAGDGFVHVLDTPMCSFVQFGAALKGMQSKLERVGESRNPLYAESRTWMRGGTDQIASTFAELLYQPAEVVSPAYRGIAIVRFNAGGDLSWGARTKLLNDLFLGNEYRLYSASERFPRGEGIDVRPSAILADQPFAIMLQGERATAAQDRQSGMYYIRTDSRQIPQYELAAGRPAHVTFAIQLLPAWMSTKNR